MNRTSFPLGVVAALSTVMVSCSAPKQPDQRGLQFAPSEVIDLGASVTEDLPQRLWGKAFLKQMGFTKQNSFEVIRWTFPMEGGSVSGSNAYYTLFNHGGPHVDAPSHMGVGASLESYPVTAFSGPVKVFDVSAYPLGRSVPATVFQGHVEAGDVVLVLTRYTPPQTTTSRAGIWDSARDVPSRFCKPSLSMPVVVRSVPRGTLIRTHRPRQHLVSRSPWPGKRSASHAGGPADRYSSRSPCCETAAEATRRRAC